MKTVDEAVLEKAIKALEDFAYRGRCDNWSEALIALDAVLEQPDQEYSPEPSVAQLNAILDGLGAAPGARQSAREFLRVWIRDWTMHKLALAQEPVAILHKHEWFRTGGMKAGQFRCIHCGTWAQEEQQAYNYAKSIAEAIWKKHYKDTAPHWKPDNDLFILLTQIDNMTAGMVPPRRQPDQEPVAYLYSTIAGVVVLHRVKRIGHAEPLYFQAQLENDMKGAREYPNAHSVVALYTTPPRRQTDQEPMSRWKIEELMRDAGWQNSALRQADLDKVEKVVRAVEQALKEKNYV
jgi:hypothetical protein